MWRSKRAKKDLKSGVKAVIKPFVIKLYSSRTFCWPRWRLASKTADENNNLLSEVSLQREGSRARFCTVLTGVGGRKSCPAGPETEPHPALGSGCNCLRLLLWEAEALFETSRAAGTKATKCLHEKLAYPLKRTAEGSGLQIRIEDSCLLLSCTFLHVFFWGV